MWLITVSAIISSSLLIAVPARSQAGSLDAPSIRTRPLGSIGFYSSGCLDSAHTLSGYETGLLKLFVERDRGYGNRDMVRLLTELGHAYYADWLSHSTPEQTFERIQVGDVSAKGGGPLTRHASHQNGLDVDVVYLRRDHRETSPKRGAGASFDEFFVKRGRVTPNFDLERNWWMFRWLWNSGQVDRIFIAPEIKRLFCKNAASLAARDNYERAEVLRVLRPYAGHEDHYHLRLKCPTGNSKCVAQAALPKGSGCSDAEIKGESVRHRKATIDVLELLLGSKPLECSGPGGRYADPALKTKAKKVR